MEFSGLESPIYKIKTKNYLIRVDQLADETYRYASWEINAKESSKPDIIIENGVLTSEGSGGSHNITFLKKEHTYILHTFLIVGSIKAPSHVLEVQKDGETILKEDGSISLN